MAVKYYATPASIYTAISTWPVSNTFIQRNTNLVGRVQCRQWLPRHGCYLSTVTSFTLP